MRNSQRYQPCIRSLCTTSGVLVKVVMTAHRACFVLQPGAPRQMGSRVRITTRGMWVDENRLLNDLHAAASSAVAKVRTLALPTAGLCAEAVGHVLHLLRSRRLGVYAVLLQGMRHPCCTVTH